LARTDSTEYFPNICERLYSGKDLAFGLEEALLEA
jgi:hypothetical protein